MAERCINLTQAEARAWAAGATCLIRRAKMEICTYREPDGPKTYYDPAMPSWDEGDVLIGREAFSTCTYWPFPTWPDGPHYWADGRVQWGEWSRPQSAVKMPKAMARHRRRVVSVRVCRECDVTWDEASAAVGTTPVTSSLQWRIAMGYLGLNFGEAWVSVTMTEAADVR